jgi:hypothetical protein
LAPVAKKLLSHQVVVPSATPLSELVVLPDVRLRMDLAAFPTMLSLVRRRTTLVLPTQLARTTDTPRRTTPAASSRVLYEKE